MKRLGQNFLVNKKALRRIGEALEIGAGETILEIGAGTGNLTREILKKTRRVMAIEKDGELVKILKSQLKNLKPKFKIIEGDVRRVLPRITQRLKNYKIVGNIPYYLTGRLFRIFQELKNPPTLIVLTIQKEVAKRISAQPPKMNQLAAIVNLWARPRILFYLKPRDFWSAPKVSSAVIRLKVLPPAGRNKAAIPEGEPLKKRLKNEEAIIQLIKNGFQQPRKTLFNNLSRKLAKEKIIKAFAELKLDDKTRSQELTVDLWIKLAKTLCCF